MIKAIILINGLIASGKNTVGESLIHYLSEKGKKASFFDLDAEVLRLDPETFKKGSEEKREIWVAARKQVALEAHERLKLDDYVIISGPFFYQEEIDGLRKFIHQQTPLFLFTLDATLAVRLERNKHRNTPSDPQELIEQDEAYQLIKHPILGEIIENSGSLEQTLSTLYSCLHLGKGRI